LLQAATYLCILSLSLSLPPFKLWTR
jgi:hypothetical protein